MAKQLNGLPLNIIHDLHANGLTRDEIVLMIGLITSPHAQPSGCFRMEMMQIRACSAGLTISQTEAALKSLEEYHMLWYDSGLMYLPMAASTRNWDSFTWRNDHAAAIYLAFADPGTNVAFRRWAERNPISEGISAAIARKSPKAKQKPAGTPQGQINRSEESEFQFPFDTDTGIIDASNKESIDGVSIPTDGYTRGMDGVGMGSDTPPIPHNNPTTTPTRSYSIRDRDSEDRSSGVERGVRGESTERHGSSGGLPFGVALAGT